MERLQGIRYTGIIELIVLLCRLTGTSTAAFQ